jgi:hypothetical protein
VFLLFLRFQLTPFLRAGKMFVGSFGGDPIQFQFDVVDAMNQFKSSGVTNLLVDVTENGGSQTFLI